MSEALLEAPAKEYRITGDNARQFQLASAKSRSTNRKLLAELARLKANGSSLEVSDDLEIVNEQIARAREALNEESCYCEHCERSGMAPSHRAQLMKSLDTFLDRRRELLGRPRLKAATPAAPKRRDPQPEPIPTPVRVELEPLPVPPVTGEWSNVLF